MVLLPGRVLCESLVGLLLPERVEVAAAAVLHEEAAELVGLEVGVERGEEGVVEQAEDLALRLRAGQLVPPGEGALVHDLHGEERAAAGARAELHEVHVADVAVAEAPEEAEVDQAQRRLRGADGLPLAVPAVVAAAGAAAASSSWSAAADDDEESDAAVVVVVEEEPPLAAVASA